MFLGAGRSGGKERTVCDAAARQAIGNVMDANGWKQKDLALLIGSQPHASEVLRRRRPLTLSMIRALSTEWNLPADALVRKYPLTGQPG